ncbi:MAG TPA: hypothetical protein PLS46_14685, partial [Microthrixaceae bacterium]|nr:hypothetical protein [Microthrixaceae bacterium]
MSNDSGWLVRSIVGVDAVAASGPMEVAVGSTDAGALGSVVRGAGSVVGVPGSATGVPGSVTGVAGSVTGVPGSVTG